MLRLLRQQYGYTLATDFGPLSLKALRQRLIQAGHSRKYINKLVAIVPRAFKWAVAEELLPIRVYEALRTVEGLRKGRTEAHETMPVTPVTDTSVNATLPHLPAVVADMVRFQRLTGARPAEVCLIRPCDVDTSEAVWSYRPESHKTEHHGRDRVIFIGPKGQDVLRPYLLREKTAYCFVPAESERKRNALKREHRQSPITPSQARRQLKRHPRRAPGDRYSTDSYRRAIARGVEKVNVLRRKESADTGVADPVLVPDWYPNQLRHSAATEIRKRFGLEAAQVALGHSQADVTQIYAERDLTLAAEVMRKIG
jgi:integrase